MSDVVKNKTGVGYDTDFQQWLEGQIRLLTEARFGELDIPNILEELEAIAKKDKREIRSRLIVLLTHLLKYSYQPNRRSRSWLTTLSKQRNRIELVLEDSPSLAGYAALVLESAYTKARREAASETGLELALFPSECPYTPEQILDPEFLPDEQT